VWAWHVQESVGQSLNGRAGRWIPGRSEHITAFGDPNPASRVFGSCPTAPPPLLACETSMRQVVGSRESMCNDTEIRLVSLHRRGILHGHRKRSGIFETSCCCKAVNEVGICWRRRGWCPWWWQVSARARDRVNDACLKVCQCGSSIVATLPVYMMWEDAYRGLDSKIYVCKWIKQQRNACVWTRKLPRPRAAGAGTDLPRGIMGNVQAGRQGACRRI
jgi:hypothetical protein